MNQFCPLSLSRSGSGETRIHMKTNLQFALNFLRHPAQNASVVPSSSRASKAMLNGIDFSAVSAVVELGPGTGVFTREIVKRCGPDTKILLIEIEESYIEPLQAEFGGKAIIERASAQSLDMLVRKHNITKVDLIVSGLPFSLSGDIKKKLFESIKTHTNSGAIFRFFTYNPPLMKRAYKELPIRNISFVARNFPPLWVYGIN